MEPELTLVLSFLLALLVIRTRKGVYNYRLAGRIGMSCMLLVTAIAHFAFADGMALMLPDFVPLKKPGVYLTGVLEFAAAILLLMPAYRRAAGWFLILFFVLLTPVNIYAALNHVNMEKADYTGEGPLYLWYRIPLQVVFIVWVYLSALRVKET